MNENTEKIRLLMVDDEEEFLMSSAKALSRRGFEVEVALNGVTALEKIESNDYDVVILDVKMPDIDGIEVFRQIGQTQPHLPVILLTGHSSLEDAFQTSKDGIADYLSKPIEIDELTRVVREVVVKAKLQKDPDVIKDSAGEQSELVRVMLIDDEVEFLESMQRVLRRRNLEVSVADSGDKGLVLLQETLVDVVVLDLKMPGMDGLEVLRRIKSDFPSVEVIILTGHPSAETAMKVVNLGANEYLKKPPEIGELVTTIRKLYRARQEAILNRQKQLIDEIRRRYPD
jgi:DNA-binding NtrC family response regulator